MLILFCMRGCGRIERPAFPAPSDWRGREVQGITRAKRAARSQSCVWEWLFENRICSRMSEMLIVSHHAEGSRPLLAGAGGVELQRPDALGQGAAAFGNAAAGGGAIGRG